MFYRVGVILIFALALFAGLATRADNRLSNVNSFIYQLQNIDINKIATFPVDMAVIDYSKDGSAAKEFSAADITTLKNSGKTILSYLSIGEAEDYRWYFDKHWLKKTTRTCKRDISGYAPGWIVKQNPDWCGNYKVKYWDRRWKNILFGTTSGSKKSSLDRIIDAGFNGIYLDIIDAFDYFQNDSRASRETRRLAAKRMAELVIDLASYARDTRGQNNFIVIVQNGTGIFSRLSGTMRTNYLNAIDGIGAEDTFFYGSRDINNGLNVQRDVVKTLSWLVQQDKKVFTIDYLTQPAGIKTFKLLACNRSFVPQVAERSLGSLRRQVLRGCNTGRGRGIGRR